ncbi:MAG: YidC/Oxa1 family insertase periplasmic-domain containing protein, partial [Pirellulaceae bacterium]
MTMTLVFIGLVVVQSMFFKPKIPDAANEQKTVKNQEDNELAAAPGNQGDEEQTAENDAADQQADTEPEADTEPRQEFPRKFVRLGEFSPEAPSLVVLVDSRGATLHRVELNDRRPNGDIRFRDVDFRNAWIGHLELETTESGCVAREVTPGTPAYLAGVREGDVLKSINGEPVVSPEDADTMLALIPAGRQIDVEIVRDNKVVQYVVTTTRMPMQVVRPTPDDQLTEMNQKRRGFQWTLKQQQMGEWPDLDEQMRFANWESELLEIDGRQVAQFKYKLPVTEDGRRFEVVKRYSLPGTDERNFHIVLDLEIRNLGDAAATVNYELCGPVGAPKEGWWYQQKIHGNTWAFFRMAGARDLVMSSLARHFWFVSGPQIVTDKENDFAGTPLVSKGDTPDQRNIRFLGVDAQYFNVALLPDNPDYECFSAFGLTASKLDDNKSRRRRTTDVSFVIYSNALELQPWDESSPDTAYRESFRIFAGPKEPAVLEAYGLQDTRTFGWFAMFSKPLIWLLHWLYKLTFSWSYGIAIIMLTVIVRMCMVPISRKAALNAQMMQHLSPEIKNIAEKYKENPEKRIQAQRELFAKYNYNPLGGCMLMFLQLPIFLGLYRGLSVDIALRDAPLFPGMSWCSNLAGPDKL